MALADRISEAWNCPWFSGLQKQVNSYSLIEDWLEGLKLVLLIAPSCDQRTVSLLSIWIWNIENVYSQYLSIFFSSTSASLSLLSLISLFMSLFVLVYRSSSISPQLSNFPIHLLTNGLYLSIHLSIYLSIYSSIYHLSTYLSSSVDICLFSTYEFIFCIYLSIHLPLFYYFISLNFPNSLKRNVSQILYCQCRFLQCWSRVLLFLTWVLIDLLQFLAFLQIFFIFSCQVCRISTNIPSISVCYVLTSLFSFMLWNS